MPSISSLKKLKPSKKVLFITAGTMFVIAVLVVSLAAYQVHKNQVTAQLAAQAADREAEIDGYKAQVAELNNSIKNLKAQKAALCDNYRNLSTARATKSLVIVPTACTVDVK